MLVHIGQVDVAATVHNAWLKTIEDGVHTYDIFQDGLSKEKVGTKEFALAVIARIGQRPATLKPAEYPANAPARKASVVSTRVPEKKDLVGVDVFLDLPAGVPDDLGRRLQPVAGDFLLAAIMNRGTKVWPGGAAETFCTDHWRCRFLSKTAGGVMAHGQVLALLQRVAEAGFDFIKTENLYNFDGKPGFS
jgi:isocitrate dehydrogenase